MICICYSRCRILLTGKQPGVETDKVLQRNVVQANKCYDILTSHFDESVSISDHSKSNGTGHLRPPNLMTTRHF